MNKHLVHNVGSPFGLESCSKLAMEGTRDIWKGRESVSDCGRCCSCGVEHAENTYLSGSVMRTKGEKTSHEICP